MALPSRRARIPGASCASLFPDNQDVLTHLDKLATRRADVLKLRRLGQTLEHRPIDAVEITDPTADALNKQHVLIVAGQHGNEETARLIALKLIDYLLSPSARPLLCHQRFVIIPNLSPDAAHRNTYTTPQGIKPNLDHGPDGPVSIEAQTLQSIAHELQPELFVDIHARGHAGCSHDMVLFPPTRCYTEDESLLYQLAREMAKAGERSGIPHRVHPLTWPGWGGWDLDQPTSTLWMYRQFKSLVFLTENCEHDEIAYPLTMRVRSGIGRLKALFVHGNRRHPSLHASGYPCGLVSGMFDAGIVAVGPNADQRRKSRIELWRHTQSLDLRICLPEHAHSKIAQLQYTGPILTQGVGIQLRVAGKLALRFIRINGKKQSIRSSSTPICWHDRYTTYALAWIERLTPGQYELEFCFQ